LQEKDERITELESAVTGRDDQNRDLQGRVTEMNREMERMRGDYTRLRQEAQEKIDKLMERIKELNQRLMGTK
jgi:uncharacterized coiled-coil protein SlyX